MRSLRFAAPIIAICALLASAAQAQVLQQVPDDSMVVIKLANLHDTSAKLADWARKMDIKQGPWADPLGFALGQAKITAGINKAGDAAIAILNDPDANNPPVVALLPVSDYAAFIGNFGPEQKDGDVHVIKPAVARGMVFYAKPQGAYAAISMSKDVLAKKAGGFAIGGQAGKFAADPKTDVAFILNTKVAAAQILPDLKQGRAQIVGEVERAFKENGGIPEFAPVIRTLVDQVFALAEDSLQGATAMVGGMKLNDAGLTMSFMAEFEPNSKLGALVSQMKNTNTSLLAGLPEADYIMYGGATVKPEVISKFVADMTDPAMAELKKVGDQGKPWLELSDAVKSVIRSTNGQTFGVIVDPAGAEKGMLRVVSLTSGDVPAIADAQTKLRDLMPKVQDMMPGPRQTLTFAPGAKTVNGVTFDKMQSQIKLDLKDPRQAMAGQFMAAIYGPNPTAYMGKVDNKYLLQVMGEDDALLQKAVVAAKAGDNPLGSAEALKAVSSQLPQNRFAEGYIAIDKLIKSALTVANANMGGDLKVDLPPNLPPIGMSLATEGTAIRADMHISGQLVQGLISAYLQMRLNMMKDNK